MDSQSCLEQGEKFIRFKCPIENTFSKEEPIPLFVMITGSIAYNLNIDNSDLDYLGVYLAPTTEFFCVESDYHSKLQTITKLEVEPKPDCTFHEAKLSMELISQGNPFIFETLFVSKYYYESAYWRKLKQHRKSFISKRTIEEFLSYINTQLLRHQKRNLPGKRIYHMVRLLFEVINMIEGRDMVVFWPDCPQRDLLMKIKTDQVSEEEFQKIVRDLKQTIEEKKPWNLPDKPNEHILEEWLVETRISHLEARKQV